MTNVLHDVNTTGEILDHIHSVMPKSVLDDSFRAFPIIAVRARLDMLLEERLSKFYFADQDKNDGII